ncbi:hypothetical protein V6N11_045406 [Hibiscus sabdariffa]|uniref:Uncharacterized protein n=1 Tax=Hibiscus sabdariffa TaxID=183260 RepID=A0ABR2Q0U9_9ROSI
MGCIAGSAMELDIADAVPGKVTDLKPDENYGRMLILFIAYDCFQNLFINLSSSRHKRSSLDLKFDLRSIEFRMFKTSLKDLKVSA